MTRAPAVPPVFITLLAGVVSGCGTKQEDCLDGYARDNEGRCQKARQQYLSRCMFVILHRTHGCSRVRLFDRSVAQKGGERFAERSIRVICTPEIRINGRFVDLIWRLDLVLLHGWHR